MDFLTLTIKIAVVKSVFSHQRLYSLKPLFIWSKEGCPGFDLKDWTFCGGITIGYEPKPRALSNGILQEKKR